VGKIDVALYESFFGKLRGDDVVLTAEREAHIKARHPLDYTYFIQHITAVVETPDIIMADGKHPATALLVKKLSDTQLYAVLRLAVDGDKPGLSHSIMTFYRVRDSNLAKLMRKIKYFSIPRKTGILCIDYTLVL